MFNQLKKVPSYLVRITTNYSTNRIKKIAPGTTKTRTKKFEEQEYLNDPNISKKILQDMQNTGSMEMEEPNMESFNEAYDEYVRDAETLKFNMKRNKMIRKHFKEYVKKEVNLLTYAEKEHIRYLHNMEPDNWSPERISESFPISSEGAKKVLNSTFRVRSFEEAMTHDQGIAKKIQLIKEGVITLTPDLKKKMELRSKVPLKIGAAQQYNQRSNSSLSVLSEKVPGEFESLVANPQKSPTKTEIPFPYSSPSKAGTEPEEELYSQMTNRDNTDKLKKLKISSNKKMTLDELETKVNESKEITNKKGSSNMDPELEYLLNLDDKTLLNDNISKASCDMWNPEYEYHPHTLCKKFNELSGEDESQLNQHQPILKTNAADLDGSIVIPPELKQNGGLYKIGNRYYDEDGQFLYRVI